ncbi:TonB-dependent receptor domain-containing protein [Aliarcobacter butzleri]
MDKEHDATYSIIWFSLSLIFTNFTLYKLFSNLSLQLHSTMDKSGNILDPEKGKGYEFGVKQKLFDDKFDLTTAYFKIEKENISFS